MKVTVYSEGVQIDEEEKEEEEEEKEEEETEEEKEEGGGRVEGWRVEDEEQWKEKDVGSDAVDDDNDGGVSDVGDCAVAALLNTTCKAAIDNEAE